MQKVQLHIRQNLLQQLWDKYVPASSPEYKNIELVYLKGGPEEMEKQPEQIQLLLQLVLKNKMLQLNLVQHPAVIKSGQKQMEHSLRRMERYYAVQLKSADPAMYRTVRRYFTLLEQVREDDRRYQTWQKTNLAIEKQKEEYRLLSLFSERLQERLEVHSISTLRTLERDFVDSLTETEYQMLAAELIWQEKPELIAHFSGWDESQCENIITELEKHIEQNADRNMRQMLSQVPNQSMKERLITAAERLGQREFCLFYHQVTKLEDIAPQFVLWKESRTEMRSLIDQMGSKALRQVWEQLKRVQVEHKFEGGMLGEHGKDVQSQETLRTQEKELLYSLLETEYQTLAERLIWQEKPDLIAHFRACEKAKCKEMIKQLEKDTHMRQVLSTIQKQSAKKKLISAAYKLEQKEFSLFYWQTAEFLNANTQFVIWKKSRAEMIRSIEDLDLEDLQQVWEQMQAVEPVQRLEQMFAEKMQHLQNQYRQDTSADFREQIAVLLEEDDLAGVAGMIDLERLMQDNDRAEYADDTQVSESGFGEQEQLVLLDGAYQVLRNLEYEREIRRKNIEQQQMQAARAYQEVYHQILNAEESTMRQQENTAQAAEQIFWKQYQEQLTKEELQHICEWSKAFLEVYFAQQGRGVTDKDFPEESSLSSDRSDQVKQLELIHVVIEKMDQYMMEHDIEEQRGTGQRLISRWKEELSRDERIQELLIYIRELEEQQKDTFLRYLADMVQLSVQLTFQKKDTKLAALPKQSDQQKSAEGTLWTEDGEFAQKLLRVEDRAFAQRLLWLEDREFAERLLQIEDREFAERLLQTEDREFAWRLLQTGDSELAGELLQDSGRQLLGVSYRSLWEWGETLLFHPEHEQEREDADVLSVSWQEAFPPDTDEAQQADIQTQVIRRQIEMAKDRNRLQSLIRQMNHQADMQLVYTDAQLRLPQIQSLLKYVQQLDEEQYGVLVKELAQVTKVQKLSYEKSEVPPAAVQTADKDERSGIEELHNKTDITGQFVQDDVYGPDRKQLRIEDKKFIEKLLQVNDQELAERLLYAQDRELAEKLLQLENEEFAERLLRIEDKEFVWKLLKDMGGLSQEVSYRNMWEWGEALLLHIDHDDAQETDERTQVTHQKNHLQSLIKQLNHQADVQLMYTDAQLKMPQIQALLQYVRQLDVKQYGAFVKELAQIMMAQKLSYDKTETLSAAYTEAENTSLRTREVSLEQESLSYQNTIQLIQSYEKQRQSALYRDIRKIGQKIFVYSSMPYEDIASGNGLNQYDLTSHEGAEEDYMQIVPNEGSRQESSYRPHELEYSMQRASVSEEDQQRQELRMQQETAQLKSVQEQLDKKLKEVEQQLKKVEDNTKAKEDVRTFAEQVKRQMYEELHVEKLRRGLI